ncbi:MFS transporter [Pseudonocardia endophytica]|uniref:Putative MFS family arabinose efflux permease n=1 Tax=Pseudonocardia endophytica TaxID=401976 RepID=A0A4R1HW89_PSEEN|nr:MFS transporter [Pseudonocardia endophytica]TCK25723.1 putative MFS family arabinose efflux permease [Pseudonocardia endophytica]
MSETATAVVRPRPGVRAWPLYVGGFLGPYASTMVTPMVQEVAEGLRSTPELAAVAVTAYMLPFAALMLVSGTLAERWGRARTMRVSLLAFVLACALCTLAPDIGWFLAARALQGATNAFTTPLLVAAITDLVPRARLGRALGLFAGMQAAGQAASPLVSGPSAVLDWRLAFVFPAGVAVALALFSPTMTAHDRPAGPPSVRALANRNLAVACALSFLCYLAAVGLTVLSILRAEEDFGLGPWQRGLLAAAFGVAGLAAAPLLGRRLDAIGPRRTGVLMNLLLAAGLVTAAFGSGVVLLGAGIAAVGIAVTGLRTTINSIATTSTDTNRAGAVSLALSFQFFGGALAPLVWVPLHAAHGAVGFAATAAAPLAALLLLGLVRSDRPYRGGGHGARRRGHRADVVS